jgi:hypothetical protein
MKGWRRIGIVLSVLWFVGFGFWLWSSETNRHYEFYKGQLSTCYAVSSMR